MKNYSVDKIRNIVLMGHGGTGKTTLCESILFSLGVTKRMGRVEDGNTVADFDKEEIFRKFTIGTSLIPVEHSEHKFNLLDTPGYFDFVGEVKGAMKAASGAVIMVDASAGVQVGTEKAWDLAETAGIPRIIFINKMDKDNLDIPKVFNDLKETFGKKIAPFVYPIGDGANFKGYINIVDVKAREFEGRNYREIPMPAGYEETIAPIREMLLEAVAESDESMMAKYFSGEEFTADEIHAGLRKGVINADVVPVMVGSADKGNGLFQLLEIMWDYLPDPHEVYGGECKGVNPNDGSEVVRRMDPAEPFSAQIFKTIVDPFVGKISLFKVLSGKAKKDMEVYNPAKEKTEKLAHIYVMRGKEQIEVTELCAGDIGATTKLQYAETGHTLCDKGKPIQYAGIDFPKPCLFMAVEPKAKGDEEKIGVALHRMMEEDPSFSMERNKETKQLLIGGQGTMQLSVIVNKIKSNAGVDVDLVDQKIAYRETIKGKSEVQGRHKKQSGGAGQFGDVFVRFEPSKQPFEFAEEVVGGSVPRQYIPAVEKGLLESLGKGVLAGYPVVNVKATLFDGSYHPVDSNEMAFKTAAHIAFKKGIEAAKPVLLEPVMHVEIVVPDAYMGDIMGDMNKRRGRILGMNPGEKGTQRVVAEAPMAEMFKYATDLRSMTQARGEFSMEFDRYEELPVHLAEKIIAEAAKEKEEENH